MKKQILILCVFLLIFFISCAKKTEDLEYPIVVETLDGIKVLTNPDYPRDGTVAFNLVEEVSIGKEIGEEEYLLNRPSQMHVDNQGYIYILDNRDCHILVYDDMGKYVRTIGRKGQGPGEFMSLAFFDFSQDGRVFVNDYMNQRITIFDREGNPLGDFKLEGFYRGMLFASDSRVYFQKTSRKKEVELTSEYQEIQMITSIFSMDSEGQNKNRIMDIETDTIKTKAIEGGALIVGGSRTIRFVWALDPRGKLYVGFSKTYQITVLNADGSVEFRFGREYTAVANEEHKENPQLNEFHPAFFPNMLIDGDSNCWIRQFTPADFEGYLYDIFNHEGIFIKQAVLSYPLYMFKEGKAYSLLVSGFDYPMVKRFRLEEIKE